MLFGPFDVFQAPLTQAIRPTACDVADQETALNSIPKILSDECMDGLGLTEEGKRYLTAVASSPPSRPVGVHRMRNLVGDVPVPKFGNVLRVESASGEYFFLLEMLWRRDVPAIYDQPQSVPLSIINRAGVATRVSYTPDFLVVHEDCVAVYELKADSAIEALCAERAED